MNREQLLTLFPEIRYVPDAELMEKCIETWLDVLNTREWDKKGIENCPVALGFVDESCPESCISHCRHVVQACKVYMDTLGEYVHTMGEFDEAVFYAAAVLHDIGKFVESDYQDGRCLHVPTAPMFTHVTTGAYYAKLHNLPDKVVYLILAHSEGLSPQRGQGFPMLELTVMRSLDFLTYSIAAQTYPCKK